MRRRPAWRPPSPPRRRRRAPAPRRRRRAASASSFGSDAPSCAPTTGGSRRQPPRRRPGAAASRRRRSSRRCWLRRRRCGLRRRRGCWSPPRARGRSPRGTQLTGGRPSGRPGPRTARCAGRPNLLRLHLQPRSEPFVAAYEASPPAVSPKTQAASFAARAEADAVTVLGLPPAAALEPLEAALGLARPPSPRLSKPHSSHGPLLQRFHARLTLSSPRCSCRCGPRRPR